MRGTEIAYPSVAIPANVCSDPLDLTLPAITLASELQFRLVDPFAVVEL